MSKISVFDMTGKKVADTELNDAVFGIEPNKSVMHAMVVKLVWLNQRHGTQSTLTRTASKGRRNESRGDRRVPVMQDRAPSELPSGFTEELLSDLSQEITAILLIKRREGSA